MSADAKQVVVVTGGNRGLGYEWIKQYSNSSDTLVVAIVRSKSGSGALQELATQKGNIQIVEWNGEDLDSFPDVANKVAQVSGGRVNVLINNAGAWFDEGSKADGKLLKTTVSEFRKTLEVNTLSPIYLTLAFVPILAKSAPNGGAKVVNISSFLGSIAFHKASNGTFAFPSYSVAKGALNIASLKLNQELRDQGITVISLNPGYVATELHADEASRGQAPLTAPISVQRMKSSVDVLTPEHGGGNYSLDGKDDTSVY